MCDYGVSFHTIENEWTERQFQMFVKARARRIQRQNKQATSHNKGGKQRYT